jgi:hypothetical protein
MQGTAEDNSTVLFMHAPTLLTDKLLNFQATNSVLASTGSSHHHHVRVRLSSSSGSISLIQRAASSDNRVILAPKGSRHQQTKTNRSNRAAQITGMFIITERGCSELPLNHWRCTTALAAHMQALPPTSPCSMAFGNSLPHKLWLEAEPGSDGRSLQTNFKIQKHRGIPGVWVYSFCTGQPPASDALHCGDGYDRHARQTGPGTRTAADAYRMLGKHQKTLDQSHQNELH